MWPDGFLQILFIFLCGALAGILFVGAGVWYVLSFFFHDPDSKENEKSRQQFPQQPTPAAPFQLPPVLLSKISDESCKSKESCWALNFLFYFLFRDLKHSEGVRRWVLRKLALEFDELLASSVLGKFFSAITIQNIDLGNNFPVVNWLRTAKVEIHPVFKSISTLDILVDLDYSGGFQFSIQAETHLKHSAFLSVQFKEVKGQARLQFSTEPYAHWSFAFAENPEIDISVVSQLYGKSFNQVTSIIAAQLKRSVRKKHTLPMYKIRYKPFFSRVQHLVAALVPNLAPTCEAAGSLTLTIVECRGLMSSLLHSNVYATVGIADCDWIAAYPSSANSIYVVRDVAYVKTAKREASLDFTLTQQGDVPVVESVHSHVLNKVSVPRAVLGAIRGASFCATECELEPGDEILCVDGKRVNTIRQCIKNFRNSTSLRVVWRIRRNYIINEPETHEDIPEVPVNPLSETDGNGSTGQASSRTESASPNLSRRNSATGLDEAEMVDGEGRRQSITFKTPASPSLKIHQLLRSRTVPFCNDPIFQEAFNLNVEESHRFLNITVWSAKNSSAEASTTSSPTSSPAKKSKSAVPLADPLPFGRDSLVGRLSIPLADIISECSTTGMGYFVKDFYLGSPDFNASEARDNPLKEHSGFEPQMCYGKVTLSFLYKSDDDFAKRKASVDSSGISNPMSNLDFGPDGVSIEHSLSPNEEHPRTHHFIRTHFRSCALCDYCNKKIWLKEAYTCTSCGMKCHKKCNERCLANTICRGEGSNHSSSGVSGFKAPEIITTESEPLQESFDAEDKLSEEQLSDKDSDNSLLPNSSTVHVRRRTLGGLIVSAVQNRTHLRRAGSAATLLPPAGANSSNATSKSLPPSPQASPTASRKASMTTGSGISLNLSSSKNPFDLLDTTGFVGSAETPLSRREIDETVEELIRNPNENLVSLAKETGKDLYAGLELNDRKLKLERVLAQLQEEIDGVTNERLGWVKEESNPAVSWPSKQLFGSKANKCEEKVQALVLLMLHFCAGLQHVQDLEASSKSETETESVLGSVGSGISDSHNGNHERRLSASASGRRRSNALEDLEIQNDALAEAALTAK